MKLKVLIAPIIIIIAIILTIGIILPKAFEVRDDYAKLKSAKENLVLITKKADKANSLSQELTANAAKQNILARYIPSSEQTEEVINNLDMLAYTEGLSLVKLSPTPKNENVLLKDEPKKAVETVSVSMSVIGSYEKIKSLLEKISGMQRFNELTSLKISKLAVAGKENTDPNQLQADMVLGFGYLNKVTIGNVNSDILNSGKFDMSAIDKITNIAKTNFSEINVEQAGKSNPFIP